jgi:hypothetical protein
MITQSHISARDRMLSQVSAGFHISKQKPAETLASQ